MKNKIVEVKKKGKDKKDGKYFIHTMGNPIAGKIIGKTPMERKMILK